MALAAAWLLLGTTGLVVLFVVMAFTWLLKAWFQHRLGGITGDVIGCINELNEILALIIISAVR